MFQTTLATAAADLAAGRTTSRALCETALDLATDPAGEGARAFIDLDRELVLAQADASDALRTAGIVPSPLAGLPISLKDLFDVRGEVTRAGSKILADAPPKTTDAPVVARLRAAGAVLFGRTNLSEFAFSGVGLNPHYGTPGNPADRSRVPGGSSSGAAVATVDGMGLAGIGSDTGGSTRIPAALCGLVGWKPTQKRVPLQNVFPLCESLDSVGPLARSVADAALLDAVLAGLPADPLPARPAAGLRLALPNRLVCDDLDEPVAAAFEAALSRLSGAEVRITRLDLPELTEIEAFHRAGGINAAQAYHVHRERMATRGADFDPRIYKRISGAEGLSAVDYLERVATRRRLTAAVDRRWADVDALIMPTVPLVAPKQAEVAGDEAAFWRVNGLLLRNTRLANFFDCCAITLPCHAPGSLPTGLMLFGRRGHDRRLFSLAAALEPLLQPGG